MSVNLNYSDIRYFLIYYLCILFSLCLHRLSAIQLFPYKIITDNLQNDCYDP